MDVCEIDSDEAGILRVYDIIYSPSFKVGYAWLCKKFFLLRINVYCLSQLDSNPYDKGEYMLKKSQIPYMSIFIASFNWELKFFFSYCYCLLVFVCVHVHACVRAHTRSRVLCFLSVHNSLASFIDFQKKSVWVLKKTFKSIILLTVGIAFLLYQWTNMKEKVPSTNMIRQIPITHRILTDGKMSYQNPNCERNANRSNYGKYEIPRARNSRLGPAVYIQTKFLSRHFFSRGLCSLTWRCLKVGILPSRVLLLLLFF